MTYKAFPTQFRIEPRSAFSRAGGFDVFKTLSPEQKQAHRDAYQEELKLIGKYLKEAFPDYPNDVFYTRRSVDMVMSRLKEAGYPNDLFVVEFFNV